MSIRYVQRKDIDLAAWDARVASETNGLVYAHSAYLDLMADNWDAIILDNYRAVMALPHRTKYGVTYLYQPPFVQQLGLMGEFTEAELLACMDKAMECFRYARINLNFGNAMEGSHACTNYILDLSQEYNEISSHFNYYLRRQTKEDKTRELLYKASAAYELTLTNYRDQYGQRFPHVHEASYRGLMAFAEQFPGMIVNREAWRKDELLSSVLLLNDGKRLYLIVSWNSAQGQKLEANRYLMDQLIREFAGRPLLLDFEGSDLPGVASYYASFGAINQPYYSMHWNKLPLPLRLLKK